MNQVLSSLIDQEVGHQTDNQNLGSVELHRTYYVEEFEVRIMEPERTGGPWQTRATIPMQSSENALTVRMVTLFVSSLSFQSKYCHYRLIGLPFLVFIGTGGMGL